MSSEPTPEFGRRLYPLEPRQRVVLQSVSNSEELE
jgi:hypothetical protein